jgi:beta-phosphoglucomutase-like phosphatase (HAD superfamily)
VLGLPDDVTACLFDLDGVLTQTATVHAAAWKQTFDEYLRDRAAERGDQFVPFDSVHDYDEYVDGKPRDDGVRSFLASRGIDLPLGRAGQFSCVVGVDRVGQARALRAHGADVVVQDLAELLPDS